MKWTLRIAGALLFAVGVGALFVHPVGFNERARTQAKTVSAGLHLTVPLRDEWTHQAAHARLVLAGRDAIQVTTKDGPGAHIALAVDYVLEGEAWTQAESVRTAVTTSAQKALADRPWADLLDGERLGARMTALRTALTADPRWTITHVRALGVELTDEGPAQQAQIAALQVKLSAARERESEARAQLAQARDEANAATAAAEAEWDTKDAAVRMQIVADVARIEGEASVAARRRRAEGDAEYERSAAEGRLAAALVRATTDGELAAALQGPAARWLNAIDAARSFELDSMELPTDPESLGRLRSLTRWRKFFLED